MDKDTAHKEIGAAGFIPRWVADGKRGFLVTRDWQMNRINYHTENGKIVRTTIG